MENLVVILEDDHNRIMQMRTSLTQILSGVKIVFFEDAAQMIAWLNEHLGDVMLISLDHDLPLRQSDGKMVDCGTGRQVADYLASIPPTCPVIVHSSNDACATGMFLALKDAGWPCSRVYPCGDLQWIASEWAKQIQQYAHDGWITLRETP